MKRHSTRYALIAVSLVCGRPVPPAHCEVSPARAPVATIGSIQDKLIDFIPGGPEGKMVLTAADVPGRLRFRVFSETAAKDKWSVTFVIDGVERSIRGGEASEFQAEPGVVELPARSPGRVIVRQSPGGPKVRLVSMVRLASRGTTLNISGPFTLRYFDADFLQDARRRAMARAVVQLQFEIHGGLGGCTAFQFAVGYFMTSLHCIENDERPIGTEAVNTLVFGVTRDNVLGEHTVRCTVVARGNLTDASRPLLDYAVLKADVPPAYADAILRLPTEPGPSLAVGRRLELYQQWSAEQESPVGKALEDGVGCRVVAVGKPNGDQAELCPYPMLRHKCATEAGSSGSAILVPGGDTVVAVHRGATVGNCALVAPAIMEDLRHNHSDIGLKIWPPRISGGRRDE